MVAMKKLSIAMAGAASIALVAGGATQAFAECNFASGCQGSSSNTDLPLFNAPIAPLIDDPPGLTFITNRTALGGTDFVDWGVLGSPFTTVSNPFSITSFGGLNLEVSQPFGSFERRNQSDPFFGNFETTGWGGNFTPGDRLIWTQNNPGPLTIDFNSPVLGAGAQIQRNVFGNFLGTIEAFDSGGISLGGFSLQGLSNDNGDNSAIFIGLLSNTANIDKLVFSVDSGSQDFAINQLDIVTKPVPESSFVFGVLVFSALGAGSVRKRKQQQKA